MKSTIRQDRALVRLSLSNRRLTSSDLCQEWRQSIGVEVSTPTIRKRLLRSGLRGCKAKTKPKVSVKQRKARIACSSVAREGAGGARAPPIGL